MNRLPIEERFDKAGGNWIIHDEINGEGESEDPEKREIKIYEFLIKFIKSELSLQQKELREEIRQEIIEIGKAKAFMSAGTASYSREVYQNALNDILNSESLALIEEKP